MLYVILVVLVVADIAEVLLTVVLGALQEAADLLSLGLVLAKEVHGLCKFEVDLAATAGITALGHLWIDLEARRNGIRRNRRALLLLEEELFGLGELGIVKRVKGVAIVRRVLPRRHCGPSDFGLGHFKGSVSRIFYL